MNNQVKMHCYSSGDLYRENSPTPMVSSTVMFMAWEGKGSYSMYAYTMATRCSCRVTPTNDSYRCTPNLEVHNLVLLLAAAPNMPETKVLRITVQRCFQVALLVCRATRKMMEQECTTLRQGFCIIWPIVLPDACNMCWP